MCTCYATKWSSRVKLVANLLAKSKLVVDPKQQQTQTIGSNVLPAAAVPTMAAAVPTTTTTTAAAKVTAVSRPSRNSTTATTTTTNACRAASVWNVSVSEIQFRGRPIRNAATSTITLVSEIGCYARRDVRIVARRYCRSIKPWQQQQQHLVVGIRKRPRQTLSVVQRPPWQHPLVPARQSIEWTEIIMILRVQENPKRGKAHRDATTTNCQWNGSIEFERPIFA
jgi:hypothetical protein